ncbi:MAG: hypothetical protein ABIN67_16030 [Ferruginibacter sp.]
MIRLLLSLLMFATTISFGQNAVDIKQKAQAFRDRLIQDRIDTILDYTLECIGYYNSEDSCGDFDAHYIFWQKNDKTFLQRIDGCGISKSIFLDVDNPLTFYINHKKQIDKEIVYPPKYIQSKDGDTEISISQSIDHTCYNQFSFLVQRKKIFKSVSEFNLAFKKFDNGRNNIYYNHNQKTELKKLNDQTAQLLKQLEANRKFEVE